MLPSLLTVVRIRDGGGVTECSVNPLHILALADALGGDTYIEFTNGAFWRAAQSRAELCAQWQQAQGATTPIAIVDRGMGALA